MRRKPNESPRTEAAMTEIIESVDGGEEDDGGGGASSTIFLSLGLGRIGINGPSPTPTFRNPPSAPSMVKGTSGAKTLQRLHPSIEASTLRKLAINDSFRSPCINEGMGGGGGIDSSMLGISSKHDWQSSDPVSQGSEDGQLSTSPE